MPKKILVNKVSKERSVVDGADVPAILLLDPAIEEDLQTMNEMTRQMLADHGLTGCAQAFGQAAGLEAVKAEEGTIK